MSRIVYLNGEFLPPEQARVSIFDRAVNFGDAVYEVAGVLDGRLVDFEHHMQRYRGSLQKLGFESPLDREQILAAFRKLVELNDLDEGLVYMQVSRGVAERDFVWPGNLEPTVFMFTQPKSDAERTATETGIRLASTPDIRWARRDIKTVNLLGQVLAKQAAHEAGADEALMVDADGFVTECGSMSFFIVADGRVLTRPLADNGILPGITRRAVIALCASTEMDWCETRFTLEQALTADEAFASAASAYVLPVVNIDDRDIGDGRPGPLTRRLQAIYLDYARASLV
ncbi:MAG TPA: D-amino acid aminotransferase [Gammaproteobacteria bacterium]|jgi:D-alanine transaminase